MKRFQLFEFMDQKWWPDGFKKMETEYLGVATRILGLYRPATARLKNVMHRIGCREIVDLCSGSGTHMEPVLEQIEADSNTACRITLTDISPNTTTYAHLAENNPRLSHVSTPVDARDVPDHLHGFRTLFAGFHHFSPDQAKNILKDASEKGTGIAVFEHTCRSPIHILSMLFTPVLVWLLTPFIRPFSLSRLFWTYIVPVAPLTILWDGIISALRSYNENELRTMTEGIKTHEYQWDFKTYRAGGIVKTTLLIGYPLAYGINPGEACAPDTENIPDLTDFTELAPQM